MKDQGIRAKILHVLEIYPVLSPSMLQVGLGPQVKPSQWRPILDILLAEGLVRRSDIFTPTPFGQHRAYTCISRTKAAT